MERMRARRGGGTARTEGASFRTLSGAARGFEQVPALDVAQTERLWRRVPGPAAELLCWLPRVLSPHSCRLLSRKACAGDGGR